LNGIQEVGGSTPPGSTTFIQASFQIGRYSIRACSIRAAAELGLAGLCG
jgi:hypothetical protein